MRKSYTVLTSDELSTLIKSGFEPEFRSLSGIFKDASALGAHIAYRELITANRISKYSSQHYDMLASVALLSHEDDKLLMAATLDGISSAIQCAARLGYTRMYDNI